jgi:hypothetical protein
MPRLTLAALIATPLLLPFGLHSLAARLEQATAAQCADQSWPVSQHAAHLEFCHFNGYSTSAAR